MGRKTDFDIGRRVDRLVAGRMGWTPKSQILVFVDTGAVIDSESEVHRWKLEDSKANIKRFYNMFAGFDLNFVITKPTLEEVHRHHKEHTVNGLPEISAENFKIAEEHFGRYQDFTNSVKGYSINDEQLRFDCYWATRVAFFDDVKKGIRDPISEHDQGLIRDAYLARYSLIPRKIDGKTELMNPDRVIILSPDEHMSKTVNFLNGTVPEELKIYGRCNYDGVRAVTSRETP